MLESTDSPGIIGALRPITPERRITALATRAGAIQNWSGEAVYCHREHLEASTGSVEIPFSPIR